MFYSIVVLGDFDKRFLLRLITILLNREDLFFSEEIASPFGTLLGNCFSNVGSIPFCRGLYKAQLGPAQLVHGVYNNITAIRMLKTYRYNTTHESGSVNYTYIRP